MSEGGPDNGAFAALHPHAYSRRKKKGHQAYNGGLCKQKQYGTYSTHVTEQGMSWEPGRMKLLDAATVSLSHACCKMSVGISEDALVLSAPALLIQISYLSSNCCTNLVYID